MIQPDATNTFELAIRAEAREDQASIRQVVAAAFRSDVEAGLVEAIRCSPEYVPEMALAALADGDVVGHVMISGAILRTDDADVRIVMLSPLAVDPGWQRRGIGDALVREVTSIAEEQGEPLVVLEGNPAYYSRFGFEHSVPFGITLPLPDWAPSEAGQVLKLSDYGSRLRGAVIYPKAFDGL